MRNLKASLWYDLEELEYPDFHIYYYNLIHLDDYLETWF